MDQILERVSRAGVHLSIFSATLQPHMEMLLRTILINPIKVVVGVQNTVVDTLQQRLIYTGKEDGKLHSLREFFEGEWNPPLLLFVQSKDRAVQLFNELKYDPIRPALISSDQSKHQRDQIVQEFRIGKTWV